MAGGGSVSYAIYLGSIKRLLQLMENVYARVISVRKPGGRFPYWRWYLEE